MKTFYTLIAFTLVVAYSSVSIAAPHSSYNSPHQSSVGHSNYGYNQGYRNGNSHRNSYASYGHYSNRHNGYGYTNISYANGHGAVNYQRFGGGSSFQYVSRRGHGLSYSRSH